MKEAGELVREKHKIRITLVDERGVAEKRVYRVRMRTEKRRKVTRFSLMMLAPLIFGCGWCWWFMEHSDDYEFVGRFLYKPWTFFAIGKEVWRDSE